MDSNYENILFKGNVATWNIRPGQIGFRYPETFLTDYKELAGVFIQQGTRALIMDGRDELILDGGVYDLSIDKGKKGLKKMLEGLRKNAEAGRLIAQVRLGQFPVDFTLQDVQTPEGTGTIRLRAVASVIDIQAFYRQFLVDRQVFTQEDLAEQLRVLADGKVRDLMASAAPGYTGNTRNLSEMSEDILACWKDLENWGINIESIQMSRLENEKEDALREAELALLHRRRELEQAVRRGEFLEELSREEHRREIRDRKNRAEASREHLALEETEHLLEKEREDLQRTLDIQHKIETARDETELQKALRDLQRTDILSEKEFETYKRLLESKEAKDTYLFDVLKIKNQQAIDQLVLEYKHTAELNDLEHKKQAGIIAARSEVEAQKIRDTYDREKRSLEQDFTLRKQKDQLEVLKAAQEVRLAREQAQHEKAVELKKMEQDQETRRLAAFGAMTAEQIMAANPGITDEAARALAEIGKNRTREETMTTIRDILEKKNTDMIDFMEKQMNISRDIIAADRHSEEVRRYLHFLQTGQDRETPPEGPNCIHCGNDIPPGARFCPHCGTKQDAGEAE